MALHLLWLYTYYGSILTMALYLVALYLLWLYTYYGSILPRPGVAVLAGTWQEVLPPLSDPSSPPFDAIFFDTFAEGTP